MNTPNHFDWQSLPDSARRVYLELLRHKMLSRAQLAERLGLSAASLTRVSAPLIERGLVLESDPIPVEIGRPSIPLDVALDGFSLIGVSITHKQIEAIATDARVNILASRHEAVTDHSPAPVLRLVTSMVNELKNELEEKRPHATIMGMGVSIGGQVDHGRVVRHALFLNWNNVPAADILENATDLPVLLGHDLTMLAEAENWFGVGLETDRFIVLTVGIGTGFALVINNHVITDENTGFGTITPGILGNDWPDFSGATNLSPTESLTAARRVGKLVGIAAAFTMPQTVVISGEGAKYLIGYEETLDAGIADISHESANGLDVRLRKHDFAFWARGAATAAIQSILRVEPT